MSANYFRHNQYSTWVFDQKSQRMKIHLYENQWLLTFDLLLSNDALHRVWGPVPAWININFCTCCHIKDLLFLFVCLLQHQYIGKPEEENFSFTVFGVTGLPNQRCSSWSEWHSKRKWSQWSSDEQTVSPHTVMFCSLRVSVQNNRLILHLCWSYSL